MFLTFKKFDNNHSNHQISHKKNVFSPRIRKSLQMEIDPQWEGVILVPKKGSVINILCLYSQPTTHINV
jgi:hypothetical protein